MDRLDPEILLEAYCRGVFPMTDHDGQIGWYTADPRGIIPLEAGAFHVPRTLAQRMRSPQCPLVVRFDTCFEQVMRQCMACREGETWISPPLIRAYCQLHEMGFAHSVETWNGNQLVGGLYGVSIGGAFFGESMFHTQTDASKFALVKLVERLRERGFVLLDSQASTEHLKRFGCVDIPASDYLGRLHRAIQKECTFA